MLLMINNWRLAPDPENGGRDAALVCGHPARRAARAGAGHHPAGLPRHYHGVAWYWRHLPRGAAGAGERVLLRFGAVDYLAEVWVNGVPSAGTKGGETPFELDVTAAVRDGREPAGGARAESRRTQPIDGFD